MKPSPAPYLEGARCIGVDIGKCIVFEDSPAGLKSAVSSCPLAVVGLTSTLTPERLLELGAHHTVDDFSGSNLKEYVLERIRAGTCI
jgi:beta-phosphoglucomutase-like phosphatase (HAD superfamily)